MPSTSTTTNHAETERLMGEARFRYALAAVELSLVEQDCQRLGHVSNGVYCEHCGALVDATMKEPTDG